MIKWHKQLVNKRMMDWEVEQVIGLTTSMIFHRSVISGNIHKARKRRAEIETLFLAAKEEHFIRVHYRLDEKIIIDMGPMSHLS